MALKQYKPTSPARRGLVLVDKSSLWKGKPVKALLRVHRHERHAGGDAEPGRLILLLTAEEGVHVGAGAH